MRQPAGTKLVVIDTGAVVVRVLTAVEHFNVFVLVKAPLKGPVTGMLGESFPPSMVKAPGKLRAMAWPAQGFSASLTDGSTPP